jgi:hypothetical protein
MLDGRRCGQDRVDVTQGRDLAVGLGLARGVDFQSGIAMVP